MSYVSVCICACMCMCVRVWIQHATLSRHVRKHEFHLQYVLFMGERGTGRHGNCTKPSYPLVLEAHSDSCAPASSESCSTLMFYSFTAFSSGKVVKCKDTIHLCNRHAFLALSVHGCVLSTGTKDYLGVFVCLTDPYQLLLYNLYRTSVWAFAA